MATSAPGGNTVRALFMLVVARDPSRPFLTFYDDATGERVELSGATLDNWVSKTANLLVDGNGLGEGDLADVALPPHWQTAAVLLGCWSAGLTVATDGYGVANAAVAFATLQTVQERGAAASTAADRYVLGLAPLGAPMRTAVPGWLDYIAEVRGYGDHFAGPAIGPAGQADQAALVAQARDRASVLGIAPRSRILVDADQHPEPTDWLLPALVVGASTILCVHVDAARLAARAASEHADLVLGPA